jgi:hypothetical protein
MNDVSAKNNGGWSKRLPPALGTLLVRGSSPATALIPLSSDANDGSPRGRLRGLHALVAIAVFFNLWSLRFERLPVAYPNDSGMHLQMTTQAMDLLRHGLSPFDHWYPLLSLGSPFFVQYQSFSAVLVGAFSPLFGVQNTFAWTLYLLLSLWPLCVYWSTRLLAWGRWESAIAAALSPLIFTVTGRGFGHQSYVWIGSGLWSQLFAMWTLPLAWAFSWRYISQHKSLFPAVLTLSLTIAFHFLTAYLAGLTLAVWIVLRPSQFFTRAGRALTLGVASLLATAWVTLPLFLHSKWLAVNQFQVGTTIDDSYGARRILSWLFSGEIYDWRRFPIMTIFVGIGLLVCVSRWLYDERARAIVGAWVLSLVLFFGRPTLGPLLDILPGNQSLLFQRYIMGVHLAGLVLAGVGAVASTTFLYRQLLSRRRAFVAASRRFFLGSSPWLRTPLIIAVAVAVLTPAWTQISTYDADSAQWVIYQRNIASNQGTDMNALIAMAQKRGGGRIYAGMPSNWGHHFYVGAVPVYIYLEQRDVDAVGFTLRTSSLMTDPEAYFDEFVPGDYAAFGVHYMILPVGHAPPIHATLLRTAGPFRLWRVDSARASALIQVVDTYGVIFANNADLGTQTSGFLESSLPGRAIYSTISYSGQAAAIPTLTSVDDQHGVAGIVLHQSHDLVYAQSASATVVAHRRAVVLLKVAYDPGWKATVDGRATPTIMLAPALEGVEVSAGRHVIVFTYHGYGDYAALYALSVVTLIGVGVGPWWWRRRLRSQSA